MAPGNTENEGIEADSTFEISFLEDDKDNNVPQDDRKPAKVLADPDENAAEKKKTTRRFFLYVSLASLLVFSLSLLMAFLLIKKSQSPSVALSAADPESSVPPVANTTTPATPTTNTAPSETDVYPAGVPVFSPSAALIPSSTAAPFSPLVSPMRSPAVPLAPAPTASPTSMAPIIIYALGDIPYSAAEAAGLEAIMDNVPLDADFVIHVGDIREAGEGLPCTRGEYEAVRDLFRRSHAPVLLAMGDNEWNDCPNIEEGYRIWMTTFFAFEREWPTSPKVQRWDKYPEAFHFVMRNVLFIGLNLVGGLVHDVDEWNTRLAYQYDSTRSLILEYAEKFGEAAKVVIIGHCDPTVHHQDFFQPFMNFVNNELQNRIPIMYLNGDKHEWDLSYDYLGAPSLVRLMVVGGSKEGPLRIEINPLEDTTDPRRAFSVQRNAYAFGR